MNVVVLNRVVDDVKAEALSLFNGMFKVLERGFITERGALEHKRDAHGLFEINCFALRVTLDPSAILSPGVATFSAPTIYFFKLKLLRHTRKLFDRTVLVRTYKRKTKRQAENAERRRKQSTGTRSQRQPSDQL